MRAKPSNVHHARPGQRHDQLVAELSTEFAVLPSGARLPSTAELKQRFGIASMTVTRALDTLVMRGEIVRIQGKGTFTACREIDTIYFLTPAPSPLWRPEDTILTSAIEAGQKLGIVIRSIYATFSNRPEDIDWNSVKRIPERAAVIVSGHWYHHLFDFLLERHCRVVYFSNSWDLHILPEYPIISQWHHLEMPYREAMCEAVRRLKAAKRRKIMLLHHCVHCGTMGILAFRAALRTHEIPHYPELELFCTDNYSQLCEILKTRFSEVPDCDAVLASHSLQAEAAIAVLRQLGRAIPGDISLLSLDEHPHLATGDLPVTVIDAAPDDSGAAAVEMLAQCPVMPQTRKLNYKVYDRKSV